MLEKIVFIHEVGWFAHLTVDVMKSFKSKVTLIKIFMSAEKVPKKWITFNFLVLSG